MTKRRNESDEFEKKLERKVKIAWRKLLKYSVKLLKWLFCYQPDNNMDLIIHLIAVFSYLYIGWFIVSH